MEELQPIILKESKLDFCGKSFLNAPFGFLDPQIVRWKAPN